MASIDANLDDLQSGMEASSRAADNLHTDTTTFNGQLKSPLRYSVARHVQKLRECAVDQRAALRELRQSVARLRQELHMAQRAAIRSQATASDLERQR